jgi:hypothetical protein
MAHGGHRGARRLVAKSAKRRLVTNRHGPRRPPWRTAVGCQICKNFKRLYTFVKMIFFKKNPQAESHGLLAPSLPLLLEKAWAQGSASLWSREPLDGFERRMSR